jgi:hypothetical protein
MLVAMAATVATRARIVLQHTQGVHRLLSYDGFSTVAVPPRARRVCVRGWPSAA